MPDSFPLVTIGLISCNRLKYLRATIESIKRCIQYPNLEIIVIDNASTETGLIDYLKSQDCIDQLVIREGRNPKSEHALAMNEIVHRAKGEYVMIWPEDVQFMMEGDWLKDCVEILSQNPWIGSMGLNAIRRWTIKHTFSWKRFLRFRYFLYDLKWYRSKVRLQKTLVSSRGLKFKTFGWFCEGIVGSGIPSLTKTDIWRKLGDWDTPGARPGLVDSSGGAETDMIVRWHKSRWSLQKVMPVLPVAGDIVDDEIGCKAKVRGFKRYGVYMNPPEGTFYYKILKQKDFMPFSDLDEIIPFEEIIKPVGFPLPLDNEGGLIKSSVNEEKVTDIN